jgi:hypothetical protein
MRQAITNTDNVEIIDPVVELPYEITNFDQVITLSESLGGKDMQGYVILKLTINDKSEILETSIIGLSLGRKNENEIIEYDVSQGELPTNLRKYAIFFDEYCKKNLIIEKRYKPQPKNAMLMKVNIE